LRRPIIYRPKTRNGRRRANGRAAFYVDRHDVDLIPVARQRGTAAAKFSTAEFRIREIAETLAWQEESVEKIIRRYVGRSAALKARIRKLETRE
jgi:hypothetical protein